MDYVDIQAVESKLTDVTYAQLLMVIEEMGRDLRPTYSGSRNSAERLKRLIVHARILVRECLVETERSARQ
uniref:Cyclin-dependent kinase 2-associated protein n=1 Tax=Anopheles albimanus TaxID=7167 RepID=A0A182FR62_ANOAL